MSEEGERLQKVLARAGLASRRVCEELIADGRVTVNGEVADLGRRVDPTVDVIEVDGALVPVAPGLVHYLLNKPAGVVTTAADTHGRPTVVDLVPSDPRVFPVGRLDADTEGLLLLTNDGELANRIAHPSHGVEKEYLAEIAGGRVSPGELRLLRITIHEGRNRQVRRMCEAVGHPVTRLVRTRIGPLSDRTLVPGAWRELEAAERRSLIEAVAAEPGQYNRST